MTDRSTFAQRFEYARARQHILGTWQTDAALAVMLGIPASQITEYKARDEAPPAKRTLAIAKICDVDPGWLAFGEDSGAPRPDGFSLWLENRAKQRTSYDVVPSTHVRKVAERIVALEPEPIPAPRPSAKKQAKKKGA